MQKNIPTNKSQRLKISLSKKQKVLTGFIFALFFIILSLLALLPSQELNRLKGIEKSLSLSGQTKRVEDDRGEYKDKDGNKHYSVNITLYFKTKEELEANQKKIEANKEWGQTMQSSIENETYAEFISTSQQSCIFTTSNTEQDKETFNLIIHSDKDDDCAGKT